MTALITKIQSNVPTQASNISLYSVLQDFLAEYHNLNTKKNYKRYLTKYIDFTGLKNLAQLSHIIYADLRKASIAFIDNYKAATTKRFVRSIVSSFWRYIVDVYHYPKNPIPSKMRLEPIHQKSNTSSLSPVNLSKKLKVLYDYRILSQQDFLACALAYTLAGTGLRISECLQITTDMVRERVATVRAKRGKNRSIELPQEVVQILDEYCTKFCIAGQVFKTSRGKVIQRTHASTLLKKHTGISAHGFRKSVIEGLIEKGIHSHEVAKVSGHSSVEMVFYYDNRDSKTDVHKDFMKSLVS